MVVLGSVTEGLPALLIFAPILFPIAVHLGIDPIHFAVVFVVAMGLGLCLPPMGILAYFAAKILGTSIERAWRPMLIMLLVPLVCLLLLALFPWITLVVPNALH
jgi:TRAP-type C4-dicarboxylate transport system permease large subunit